MRGISYFCIVLKPERQNKEYMEQKKFSPSTLCVQGGWKPSKGEPRVLPIYQSTTFKYDTSEQMARLFDLEDSGYF